MLNIFDAYPYRLCGYGKIFLRDIAIGLLPLIADMHFHQTCKGEIRMTTLRQVYRCDMCGNIVEMLHAGDGTLVCCGQPMTLQVENTVDAAKEKHVPVIEKIEGGVLVNVGTVEHPMIDTHFIEWIEIHTTRRVFRKFLSPGGKPQAIFMLGEEVLYARAYCNIHRLWRS
jgi:superoxide reductase